LSLTNAVQLWRYFKNKNHLVVPRVSNETDFGMEVLSALMFLGHIPGSVESITVRPNYYLFHFAHIFPI
jgi:hypothetical protein